MTFDERVEALGRFELSDRQARFLVHVMLYAGVCLPRQYAAFAGTAYGHTASRFFSRLVERGYASATACVHNRARVYHVHHRPLYRAIGEPESPHRRPVPASRLMERLMVLDTVIASPDIVWLATTEEKVANLLVLTGLTPDRLPQLPGGPMAKRTVRLFPDRLPIGVQLEGRAVLPFAVTEPSATELRAFLQRHRALLHTLRAWTLRLLIPPHLSGIEQRLDRSIRHELTAVPACTFDELRWYFNERRARARGLRSEGDDARYERARRAFRSPRHEGLYRVWLWQGDHVLEQARSLQTQTALASGAGRIEWHVLPYPYRHLSPLVTRRSRRGEGVEEGDTAPTQPRPPADPRPADAMITAAHPQECWS
jgi:hypothetical protein